MAQAQHAARGKLIMLMVTFVVICVCIWSTVCFSYTEADSFSQPHQMNTEYDTSKNEEALSIGRIIGMVFESIRSIAAITTAIAAIIGAIIAMNAKGLSIFPCVKKWRFIKKLKQAIPDNPPNWNPLPDCKSSVELAMIRVNRKEEQRQNKDRVKNRVFGDVEKVMDSSDVVEVKAYQIFDSGLFKDDGSIILLQGGPGMGKTTLGYSYCKKWKDGGLHKFDMAAFVSLRETDKEKVVTFDNLLFLACRNDEVMKEELKHYVETGTSLLLVLDGWDEAPDMVRKSPGNFIHMLHRSVSSQSKSKILITSRPDSSVNLDVNRVEIMGFTHESISNYFKEALRTTLNDEHEIEDGCKELENHFKTYPSIQSCCAIPLNAAIVARLFLASKQKPRILPHTRYELFSSIVAHLINKEQEKYCASAHKKSCISSLEDLPVSIKKPLCELAFHNLKEIVIPHEMVASTQLVECENANPTDASLNSATTVLSPYLRALLQTVEKRDRKSGGITYYYHFIHLSMQELLAAYHISRLGEVEQVKVFQDLLDKPRFSAVLQFYAAFTRFTNKGVRDIITGIDLHTRTKQHTRLTIIRCCYEAQIETKSFYKKIMKRRFHLYYVALTPFDCMSIGYFLAFALRVGELHVALKSCSIDDHSFGLLLGELSRHDKAYPRRAGVLQGVANLNISRNNIGDDGIAHLASALWAGTTMKILDVSLNHGITSNGAKSLGRALSVNKSLEELYISDTSIGDEGVAHIANALQKHTTMKVLNVSNCGISDKGAESLARALASRRCSLERLNISLSRIGDDGIAHIATALQTNSTLKSLTFRYDDTAATDEAALSLARALKTNTSMEDMKLDWSSKYPSTTLKTMAEHIRNSTLRELKLKIYLPSSSASKSQVDVEKVRQWLQDVEEGGKEFILSLEACCLKSFSLDTSSQYFSSSVHGLKSQIRMSLKEKAALVNTTRKMYYQPEIKFSLYV